MEIFGNFNLPKVDNQKTTFEEKKYFKDKASKGQEKLSCRNYEYQKPI